MMVEKMTVGKTIVPMPAPMVAFGNPVLDIVVSHYDENLLEKYGLPVDGEVELPEEKIQEILADLSEFEQKIGPGGPAQNTARVFQRLGGGPEGASFVIFCGGLGKDTRGSTLEKLVKTSGIQTKYAKHSALPTGIRISLISGTSNCLVTNLGAANVYTEIDLLRSNLSFDKVKIIYIEGLFITHSLDVAKEIIDRTQDKNIIIAFNLGGEYIFEKHHAAICEMVGLAKIVFGNAREMTALAKSLNLEFESVTDIPFLLNSSKRVTVSVTSGKIKDDWLKDNDIFVMTPGGTAPAIVVWSEGHSVQVDPEELTGPIVDTTEAGDSFVAGFLAGVFADWNPKDCLECGCNIAAEIITEGEVQIPRCQPDTTAN